VGLPFWVSLATLIVGVVAGVLIYRNSPEQDKLSGNAISNCFANRLYIDKFYDNVLIKGIQGTFAAIVDFFDQFLISGLIVGGLSRLVAGIGSLLRKLQSGYLPLYTLIFGIGILLVIYFLVFCCC
jgi:NADH-quinone oxidoreductase subunit L